MYKKILYHLLSIIFLGALLSCDRRDLNKQIDFFESQGRDPQIIGTWKKLPANDRYVHVIDFIANGHIISNKGTPYFRYYTKTREKKLYLLRTGNHSNNPIVEITDYAINGDTLTVIFQNGVKSTYVKLWDD